MGDQIEPNYNDIPDAKASMETPTLMPIAHDQVKQKAIGVKTTERSVLQQMQEDIAREEYQK